MYESFYQLTEKPFSLLPDPHFLFHSSRHDIALAQLQYGLMSQAGFCVITGDIGTGKTTLIRHVLAHMDRDVSVGLISNTHQSFGELLEWVSQAFGLDYAGKEKVELYNQFMEFMIREYAHGRHTVLIVDEAQNMSVETLEELRVISNINADKDQLLQIILVGQLGLKDNLMRPDMLQFAQRIAISYQLKPLSEKETRDYIRHRVQVAGGQPDLFDAAACRAVFRYSGGVPRLINSLCDTALVYGYAAQKAFIDAGLVHEVARDKGRGGIFPVAENPDEAAVDEEAPVAPVVERAEMERAEDAAAEERAQASDADNGGVDQAGDAAAAAQPQTPDADAVETVSRDTQTPLGDRTAAQPGRTGRKGGRYAVLGGLLAALLVALVFGYRQQREAETPSDNGAGSEVAPATAATEALPDPARPAPVTESVSAPVSTAAVDMAPRIGTPAPSAMSPGSEASPGEAPVEIETPVEIEAPAVIAAMADKTESLPPASEADVVMSATARDPAVTREAMHPTADQARAATDAAEIHAADWILAQPADRYTLHVASTRSREHALDFIHRHGLEAQAAYFTVTRADVTWHSVIYGIYPNMATADAAARELPPEVIANKPWTRNVGDIQKKMDRP